MKKVYLFLIFTMIYGIAIPQTAVDHFNKGRAMMAEGMFSEAIIQFNNAIYLDPDWAGPVLMRGISWRHLGESERYITDYNAAFEMNPLIGQKLLRRDKHFPVLSDGSARVALENYTGEIKKDEWDWNFAENPFRGLNSSEPHYWNRVFSIDIPLESKNRRKGN